MDVLLASSERDLVSSDVSLPESCVKCENGEESMRDDFIILFFFNISFSRTKKKLCKSKPQKLFTKKNSIRISTSLPSFM